MIYSPQFIKFALWTLKLKLENPIREIRNENDISQKDLSYKADLDRSYIASVENGQRNISIVNLEKDS